MAAKSGLCAALGNNVFDYGHRAAADQMRTSWEKLVQTVRGHKWAGHFTTVLRENIQSFYVEKDRW
jgi:hypothetical protein